ncbi:MAG: type IV pilus secretin PilQ, partial [Acidobacteriota bacterium]
AFSTFELDDPLRLVIDLELLINEVPAAVIPVTSPYMRRLRVSQFKESPQRVARAVIDLTGPSSYQVVPTAEGLSIILDRSSLPSPRDLQIARSPAPPTIEEPAAGTETPAGIAAPVRSASAATAPAVATAPGPESVSATEAPLDTMVGADTAGSSGAEMPVPAFEVSHVGSLLAQADAAGALDDVNPDDYAYYSLAEPDAAAGGQANTAGQGRTFESRTLSDDVPVYTGRRISLELVDADLKQIFRLFHEISGLNFVLDPSVAGKVTIVLDNVPWDLALDIILRNNGLDKVFEHNVMRIATTAKLASEAQQRRALKEAARMEQDPVTVSRVLSYARAEEMDQIVRRILSSGAGSSSRSQSFFDTRTNTLVYSGIPEQVEEINKLIDELDVQAPQVTIEARIIETSREFVRDLGIIWNVLVSDNPNTGTGNGFKQFSYDVNLPAKQVSNLGISFGDFGPSAATLNLTIDALEQEGHARTLSAPRIAAQNNTTAVIEQGVQIPVVNTTATEINVEFISASLKLEVTPQITAEGTVIMDIKVDNSSPDFNNTVGDTPSIVTERADTRVLVEDGGTTVIGGVFLLTEGESETGVPGLRKIPGLGWLFKKKNVTKENKELLIFITPKIMS